MTAKATGTVVDLLLYFLRLGTTGFGGPVALVGYMQRDLVEERRWFTPEEYREGLALAQLAPGPLAAQLAMYLGWVKGRAWGAALVGLAFVPNYFRVTRALVLAARSDVYVDAERALGARTSRILAVHVLPNVLPPLFILVAMDIPGAIAVAAGLSFLGLGVQPPTADWGVMLNEGFLNVYDSAWPLIAPCVALVLVTLGFTFLGETLRDVFDPRVSRTQYPLNQRRKRR